MSNNSIQEEQAKLTAVINGVNTQLPATTSLNLLGKAWTPAQLVQAFEAAGTAVQAVTATRAQLKGQITAQAAAFQAARQLYSALEKYLEGTWGKGSPVLAQFGFNTTPPKKPSAETKAAAAAQAKLTRKARGTLGKRQKQAVTVAGHAGLVLVGANGQQIPGATQGPIAPAVPPGSPIGSSTK